MFGKNVIILITEEHILNSRNTSAERCDTQTACTTTTQNTDFSFTE